MKHVYVKFQTENGKEVLGCIPKIAEERALDLFKNESEPVIGFEPVNEVVSSEDYEMNLKANWREGERINRYFEHVCYNWYSIYGKCIGTVMLQFDFDKEIMYANGRKYKVEKDMKRKYVHKVMKTKVKAIDGINRKEVISLWITSFLCRKRFIQ